MKKIIVERREMAPIRFLSRSSSSFILRNIKFFHILFLATFRSFGSNRSTRQILIKLQIKISIFTLKTLKKIRWLRDSNFGDGVPVIHTFNIFEESKMCHILTSNFTHHLIILRYIVLEEHYTMYVTYYFIILEQREFKSHGVVIC